MLVYRVQCVPKEARDELSQLISSDHSLKSTPRLRLSAAFISFVESLGPGYRIEEIGLHLFWEE